MSAMIGNPADAAAIRPFTIPEVPQTELEALRARVAATRGHPGNWSLTGRRAYSWRPSRSSPATGRPITTGARARRG
jgi:hypothetical protein